MYISKLHRNLKLVLLHYIKLYIKNIQRVKIKCKS
jgi:hypothetical protein